MNSRKDGIGPLWWRGYALEENEQAVCDSVERVIRLLGVRRLVMGPPVENAVCA